MERLDPKKAIEDLIETHKQCSLTIDNYDVVKNLSKLSRKFSEIDLQVMLMTNQLNSIKEIPIENDLCDHSIKIYAGIFDILNFILSNKYSGNPFSFDPPKDDFIRDSYEWHFDKDKHYEDAPFPFLAKNQLLSYAKTKDLDIEDKLNLLYLLQSFINVSTNDAVKIIATYYNITSRYPNLDVELNLPNNNVTIFKEFSNFIQKKDPNIIKINTSNPDIKRKLMILNNYKLHRADINELSSQIFSTNCFEINTNSDEYAEYYFSDPELLFLRSNNFRKLLANADCNTTVNFFYDEIESIINKNQPASTRLKFMLTNEYLCWSEILTKNVQTAENKYTSFNLYEKTREFLAKNPLCSLIYTNNRIITSTLAELDDFIEFFPIDLFKNYNNNDLFSQKYMLFYRDPYTYDPINQRVPDNIANKFKINLAYFNFEAGSKKDAYNILRSITNPDFKTKLDCLRLLELYDGWFKEKWKKEIIMSLDDYKSRVRTNLPQFDLKFKSSIIFGRTASEKLKTFREMYSYYDKYFLGDIPALI